jgi:hypothetical protein
VRHLVPFHHDPSHDDDQLDALYRPLTTSGHSFGVTPAREGETVELAAVVASA